MNPNQNFINDLRYKHIMTTKALALQHGRCKEQFEGKCSYPHCQCLFGETGPIDPITGEEIHIKTEES